MHNADVNDSNFKYCSNICSNKSAYYLTQNIIIRLSLINSRCTVHNVNDYYIDWSSAPNFANNHTTPWQHEIWRRTHAHCGNWDKFRSGTDLARHDTGMAYTRGGGYVFLTRSGERDLREKCTIVQSAVLGLHVVRLSVCSSVRDVGGSGPHREWPSHLRWEHKAWVHTAIPTPTTKYWPPPASIMSSEQYYLSRSWYHRLLIYTVMWSFWVGLTVTDKLSNLCDE